MKKFKIRELKNGKTGKTVKSWKWAAANGLSEVSKKASKVFPVSKSQGLLMLFLFSYLAVFFVLWQDWGVKYFFPVKKGRLGITHRHWRDFEGYFVSRPCSVDITNDTSIGGLLVELNQ